MGFILTFFEGFCNARFIYKKSYTMNMFFDTVGYKWGKVCKFQNWLNYRHRKLTTICIDHFEINEPCPLNLRYGSDSDQNFHYQILALDLGGDIRTKILK